MIAFWLIVFIVAATAFLLVRNQRVYKFRMNLISKIREAGHADIDSRLPWEWCWEAFEDVSYFEQVFKFWKPLDSFYPDQSFLDPAAVQKDLTTNK